MVEVVWTTEALTRIRPIEQSLHVAARVVEGITSRVEGLKYFPESGAVLSIPGVRSLRMILYGHYRIVYRRESVDRIEIIGVHHGALDVAHRLSRRDPDSVNE